MRRLLLLLACLASAVPAFAATALVHSGEDLQLAITNAACGDTIVLDAGASWNGPFYLPNKGCTGPAYITITGSASLPTVCQILLASCRANWIANAANFPKIIRTTTYSAIFTNFGAGWYRLLGLEISDPNTAQDCAALCGVLINLAECGSPCTAGYNATHTLSDLPHDIMFDQLYIHGTLTGGNQAAITSTGTNISLLNSYIEKIHRSFGIEAFGFYHQTEGPVTVRNNYISAAGINVFFGDNNALITDSLPHDGLIEDNYLTKDCREFVNAAAVNCAHAYDGWNWTVKNSSEMKRGVDFIWRHNIIENSWDNGQTGLVVLFQMYAPPAQAFSSAFGGVSPACTWCTLARIEFAYNIVRHGAEGLIAFGRVSCCSPVSSPISDTLSVHDNLFYDISKSWSIADIEQVDCFRPFGGWLNVTFSHNTCDNEGTPSAYCCTAGIIMSPIVGTEYNTNITFKDSFFRSNQYGITGPGGSGTAALNSAAPGPTWTWSHMVITQDLCCSGSIAYPATTTVITTTAYDAIFADRAIGPSDDAVDYRVVQSSAYKAHGASQASDGTDVGANMCLLPDPQGLAFSFDCGVGAHHFHFWHRR